MSPTTKGNGKGKGKGKGGPTLLTQPVRRRYASGDKLCLEAKKYKDDIEDMLNGTAVLMSDVDEKVVDFLDALAEKEKATEACEYLTKSLGEVKREDVKRWPAYIYMLLRNFDEDTYAEMKTKKGGRVRARTRSDDNKEDAKENEEESKAGLGKYPLESFKFNAEAVAFVPKGPINPNAQAFANPKAFLNPNAEAFVPSPIVAL